MIGAVVVLYNPTKEEICNINSYKDLVEYTVIIDNSDVDNRSIVDEFVNLDLKTVYYSNKQNLGLAKGFNIGMEILINKGCEWGILFDADSKLEVDIISVYVEAIKNNDCDVSVFSPVHIFDRSTKKTYKGYKYISWAMTSGCLYNCKIFEKQKGFFEELFVDGIDIDYCLKSNKNGYKVIECGEAMINHKPAETKKLFGFKYGIASPYRYYMQARQLIWNWKRYRSLEMFLIYLYKWFKVIVLFPTKMEYVKMMIKGSGEGNKLFECYCEEKNDGRFS